ncbi:MAG TPA: hypothetical protein VLA95_10875 [Gemmatimonadales bacterium]|nr:hypothetical protein [Gemmatimonadales bacterium]
MSAAHRLAGLAVAAAALAGTTVLSQWPWQVEGAGRSLLRISWRARGERIENCRRATAEELAALPAHMRQETICEDARVAPYRLRVAVDGRSLADSAAPGSGIPGDRPIYVYREFEVTPGARRVEVRFERTGEAGEEEGTARRRAVPPRLVLDTVVTVGEGSILLVTYSPEHRNLVLLGP